MNQEEDVDAHQDTFPSPPLLCSPDGDRRPSSVEPRLVLAQGAEETTRREISLSITQGKELGRGRYSSTSPLSNYYFLL